MPSSLKCAWLLVFVLAASCAPKVTAPPERPASVRRGDLAFREGHWEAAIQEYGYHLDAVSRDAFTARAAYKSALAAYRLQDYELTLDVLRDMDQRYPDYRWVQVEALRGDARFKSGQSLHALQAWDQGWRLADDYERRKLRPRVETVLGGFNDVQLASARRVVASEGVIAMVDDVIRGRQPADLIEPDLAELAEAQQVEDIAGVGEAAEAEKMEPAEVAAAPAAKPLAQEFASVDEEFAPAPLPQAVPAAAAAAAETPPAADFESDDGFGEAEFAMEASYPAEEPAREPAAEAAVLAPPPAVPGAEPAEFAAAEPPEFAAAEPPAPAAAAEEVHGRGPETVSSAVARALQDPLPAPVETAEELSPAPEVPAPRRLRRVAAILSLTGDDRNLGAERLRGLRTAFDGADERLVIRDSGSEAPRAERMLKELAGDTSVVAVISLLRTQASRSLARKARQLKLPFLYLSEQNGKIDGFTVEVGPNTAPIDALLRYAVGGAGLRRFGMVHPGGAGGTVRTSAFQSSVRHHGGSVVGVEAYVPGSFDMTELSLAQWREQNDLQALFVADGSDAAAEFARFLGKEMPGVALLGIDGWHTLTAHLAGESEALGWILFTGGLRAGSGRPATRQFVERFERRYGETPMLGDAQVYDAGVLARFAIDEGVPSREEVLPALKAQERIPGALGDLDLGSKRLRRDVLVLQFQDGRLQEIGVDAAP
jgi:ABC-type branched-subunit amino acid transport system substrate-binding protein